MENVDLQYITDSLGIIADASYYSTGAHFVIIGLLVALITFVMIKRQGVVVMDELMLTCIAAGCAAGWIIGAAGYFANEIMSFLRGL